MTARMIPHPGRTPHRLRISTGLPAIGVASLLLGFALSSFPARAETPAPAVPAPVVTPAIPAAPVTSAAPAVASAGSAEAGERVFLKCRACHQIGEGAKHMVGPELNGMIGRKAGTVDGYHFSDAMKNSGLTWDAATLHEYLRNPRLKVKGTRMIFVGLTRDKDIDDLLAYVAQFDATGKKSP